MAPQAYAGGAGTVDSALVPNLDGATSSAGLEMSSIGFALCSGGLEGAAAEPGNEDAASTGADADACTLCVRTAGGAVAENEPNEPVEAPSWCPNPLSSGSFCLAAILPGEVITPLREASTAELLFSDAVRTTTGASTTIVFFSDAVRVTLGASARKVENP